MLIDKNFQINTEILNRIDRFLLVCKECITINSIDTQTIPMFIFDSYRDAFNYMMKLEPPINSTVISDTRNDEGRSIKYTIDHEDNVLECERIYYVQTIAHK